MEGSQPQPQPQPTRWGHTGNSGAINIIGADAGLGVRLDVDVEADGPVSSSHTVTFSEERISAVTTTEDDNDDYNRGGNSSISPSYKRLKALRVTGQLSRPIIYDETQRPIGPKSNGL